MISISSVVIFPGLLSSNSTTMDSHDRVSDFHVGKENVVIPHHGWCVQITLHVFNPFIVVRIKNDGPQRYVVTRLYDADIETASEVLELYMP